MANISYTLSLTGDCFNQGIGIANILPTSGTPPYTFEWVEPYLGVDYVAYQSTRTGLYPGDYSVIITDSLKPTNNFSNVNIIISSGICCSIYDVSPTTCNLNNGSVTGFSDNSNNVITFNLYTNEDILVDTKLWSIYGVFDSLSAGTYYITAQDFGGCSAKSESFIVENSATFDFGLYTVPNTSCGGLSAGKIYVTGQTYGSPYTYFWNTNETTSYITGLTNGSYSVQVTNRFGCTVTKNSQIVSAPPIGQTLLNVVSPSCFGSNGEITLSISGGTPPYYYSASTGNFEISYSDTFSLTGLNSGQYNFLVTDAGFCTFQTSTLLETPNSVSSFNVQTQNSICSSVGGSILLLIGGGAFPYSYTIVYPNGDTITNSSSQTSYLFDKLDAGTYTVGVEDANGCGKTQEVLILTQNKYTISTQVTNTPSGVNNGIIEVQISEGATPPYTYYIDDSVAYANTILTAVTFYNVSSGQHSVSVTDYTGCKQTTQVVVTELPKVNFYLSSKSAGSGSEGEITAFISSGVPPFVFNWSENIPNNPQMITVTGLTAGTYSLVVADLNGSTQKRTIDIPKINKISSYETFTMGEQQVQVNTEGKYSLSKMLNEGYIDIISGHTGCELVLASFTAKVNVQPYNYQSTNTFFTTTSLLVSPEDNLWYDTAKELLLSVQGVSNVIIDELNNKFTVEGDLSVPNIVGGNNPISISLSLGIDYDISCIS
jgi:hypothetical protein